MAQSDKLTFEEALIIRDRLANNMAILRSMLMKNREKKVHIGSIDKTFEDLEASTLAKIKVVETKANLPPMEEFTLSATIVDPLPSEALNDEEKQKITEQARLKKDITALRLYEKKLIDLREDMQVNINKWESQPLGVPWPWSNNEHYYGLNRKVRRYLDYIIQINEKLEETSNKLKKLERELNC